MEHSVEQGMFVRCRVPGGRPLSTVVLVHGLGESGLCFERLLGRPELGNHRLLVPDLPGYGRSAWPARRGAGSGDDLAGIADHLAHWLGERGEGRVRIVGHSMGGVVGLLLAERHPDLVAGLIDVDGNKSAGDCLFSGRAAGETEDAFARGGFDEMRDDIYRQGLEDPALRGYYASLRLADPRVFHRHARELVTLSGRDDLARRLAARPEPRHYVAGSPRGACARSRELLGAAGVPTTEIAPSGHWPFIDQPDRFATLLATLLA
jgi:pimeloyl-ACP methyl ester carboxylesterase